MIYFVILYTIHSILDLNLICIFKFTFKRTLMSFKFFFCVFKKHIVDLIHFILIKTRFNIFMWSSIITYFLVLIQEYLINCTVNNSIIIFLNVKFISVCVIMPAVLSRPNFTIIRTKVSQDLEFILWIPGAMVETCGFGPTLWIVYISFPDLARDITNLGVIIWGGRLYSLWPAVTTTVGICLISFFKIRFHSNFLNIFRYTNALKHINSPFESNRSEIKYLNIRLLDPTIGHTIQQDLIQLSHNNFSVSFLRGTKPMTF